MSMSSYPSRHLPRHPYFSDALLLDPLYGQRESHIRKLQDRNLPCPGDLGWNLDYATAFLVNHLEQDSTINGFNAAKSIDKARRVHPQEHGRNGRDIVYKTFHILDKHLFAGNLKDAVYLTWTEMKDDVSGATLAPGANGVPRISIYLNLSLHRELPAGHLKHALASLLHHMIHAYFLRTCGPQKSIDDSDGRMLHGKHFGKIMYKIKALSIGRGHEHPIPIDFGHKLLKFEPFLMGNDVFLYPHHRAHRHFTDLSDRERFNGAGTECKEKIPKLPPGEIDVWYEKTCKPLLEGPEPVQRNTIFMLEKGEFVATPFQSGQKGDFVIVMYDDKPIQIPRETICGYKSLNKAIGNKLIWEVSKNVQSDIFKALWDSITNNEYSYAQDFSLTQKGGYKGPPVFRSTIKNWGSFMLTDVRVYKLACALKFAELGDLAKSRLYGQGITHENPVYALNEIYDYSNPYAKDKDKDDGKYPYEDLRTWAVDFLKRKDPSIHRYRPQRSNLEKLWSDSQFKELYARNRALKEDCCKALLLLKHRHVNISQLAASEPSYLDPFYGYSDFMPIPPLDPLPVRHSDADISSILRDTLPFRRLPTPPPVLRPLSPLPLDFLDELSDFDLPYPYGHLI